MPGFFKQTFIVMVPGLLCFGRSLSIKSLSMNNHSFMVRPTHIDLNADERHYCPFIISIQRRNRSCYIVENPFSRIFIPNKKKTLCSITGINE